MSQDMGIYHYHNEPGPGCVYTDVKNQHSPLFAVMYDGVPLYGVYGDNGIAPTNLDECNGHVDTSHNYYHYHLPANLTYPYTVNCLKGCLDNTVPKVTGEACNAATTQYDYSSLKTQLNSKVKTFNCSSTGSLPPPPGSFSSKISISLILTFFVLINLLF